ncbi:MAG: hypothetical protein BIFFINMI_03587 [Phycisphaerae bacterium]|nr:hypothetical protein [Phycisphaerae bacterium]
MSERVSDGTAFEIPGAAGQVIRGNVHLPTSNEHAGRLPLLLMLHGFKGYKDYGFFPYLAQQLADAGLAVARFNFSHSGMDDRVETFGRPDLFEKDSWLKQLDDVQAVLAAAEAGALPHASRIDAARVAVLGHSRGGVVAMLTGGADTRIGAVVSVAAPASADNLSDEQKQAIREQGHVVSPSSRTGQQLRIGPAWLEAIETGGRRVNLPAALAAMRCPLLLIHGSADASVPCQCLCELAESYSGIADQFLLDGVNHVLNCANPFAGPSPALRQVVLVTSAFLAEHLATDGGPGR